MINDKIKETLDFINTKSFASIKDLSVAAKSEIPEFAELKVPWVFF